MSKGFQKVVDTLTAAAHNSNIEGVSMSDGTFEVNFIKTAITKVFSDANVTHEHQTNVAKFLLKHDRLIYLVDSIQTFDPSLHKQIAKLIIEKHGFGLIQDHLSSFHEVDYDFLVQALIEISNTTSDPARFLELNIAYGRRNDALRNALLKAGENDLVQQGVNWAKTFKKQ